MIYFHYQINGDMIMNIQKTGKYIVKLRKGKGWTQLQLAEQLSVSPQAFLSGNVEKLFRILIF